MFQIALIHKDHAAREILARALHRRLHSMVTDYSCIEDLMLTELHYDVFVVYKDLGHHLNGVQGVKLIREKKPDALIIGVSNMPNTDREFLPAGANAFLLRSGNEVEELQELILKKIAQWVNTPPRPQGE
ncbi:MAG: response regulator [Chloroflexi bacterium]|nr:response regulator [Chloroflexota bacterium]